MLIKDIRDEDFINYKKAAMFIACPTCTFKCDVENGCQMCQNMILAHSLTLTIDTDELIKRYLDNPITHAVVFGGLEPIDSFDEVHDFIKKLRETYHCEDDVVIYTGYNRNEVLKYIYILRDYPNIIFKFGRFRPDQQRHFDKILGVYLVSDNQFAEKIS